MVLAFTLTKMVPNMKDIGRMTYNMDTVKNHGPMAPNTKVSILTGKNMDKDIIFGTMALSMMVNGLIIKLKVTVFTNGKMVVCLLAIGSTIICMEKVPTCGETVGAMRGNTLRIGNMDLEYINGLMEEFMKVNGMQANNTVTESIRYGMERTK